jgi:hypothetical protein
VRPRRLSPTLPRPNNPSALNLTSSVHLVLAGRLRAQANGRPAAHIRGGLEATPRGRPIAIGAWPLADQMQPRRPALPPATRLPLSDTMGHADLNDGFATGRHAAVDGPALPVDAKAVTWPARPLRMEKQQHAPSPSAATQWGDSEMSACVLRRRLGRCPTAFRSIPIAVTDVSAYCSHVHVPCGQALGSVLYGIWLYARNGPWNQNLRLRRSDKAACWLVATRVLGIDGRSFLFEHRDR